MKRSTELLKAAVEALEDGSDPLSPWFLEKHAVTLYEAQDLADSFALGARLLVWAKEHPKDAVVAAAGAMNWLEMDLFTRLMTKLRGA